jgi:hypothetical protein
LRSSSGKNSELGRSITLFKKGEHFAMSEGAKEVLFIKPFLDTTGIDVQLPKVTRVDNIGARNFGNNVSVSQQTKHVDIQLHLFKY